MKKILLDLQALEGESSFRGIGRWTLNHSLELLKNKPNDVEVYLLLNDSSDNISEIKKKYPNEKIITYSLPISLKNNQKNWFDFNLVKKNRIRVSELLREYALSCLNPDFVLVYSYFDSYFSLSSLNEYSYFPTGIILYDFIPMHYRDEYLSGWREDWYNRKISFLKGDFLCLSISDFVRDEAKSIIKNCESIFSVDTATSDFWKKIEIPEDEKNSFLKKYGIEKPFILYSGGIDHRKNVRKLIESFSKYDIRSLGISLFVVCGKDESGANALKDYSKKLGLSEKDINFVTFVSDEDLRIFYNLCKLFVFPSLDEGFGLTPLEAMSCSAPVIASNSASIPQVVGDSEALFEPTSISSIAEKIKKAIEEPDFYNKLLENSKVQSRKFTWKNTADKTWEYIENYLTDKRLNKKKLCTQEKFLDIASSLLKKEKDKTFIREVAESVAFNSKLAIAFSDSY